jgi:hypothetical protein
MTEKKDKLEWDEGFGELYEDIKERKARKIFPPLEDIAGWKKEKGD